MTLRILLVDDDEVDRIHVRRLLRQTNLAAEVTEAVNAESGLVALRTSGHDCVLLDFQMPGHDGRWVLQTARAEGIRIPFVMLTGQGDEQTAVELMKAGASDYLPKGALSADRLAQSLRQTVRLHQAEADARRAAERLTEEQQRFRIAVEATQLGIWDYNATTGTLHLDRRCRELFGLSQDSEATSAVMEAAMHPEDREKTLAQASAALHSESLERFEMEFRTVGPGGFERWCRTTGRSVWENGRLLRFTGTIQDISERKRQEAAERKHAEFQQQLIGIVSHDLRNPISAMIMSASTLLKREEMDPRSMKGLARIVSSGERATRLIRDLLDFTQATLGGKLTVQMQPTDINDVIRGAVEEVQQAHPARQITFVCQGDGHGHWDPDRISQVATNLLVNAVTYSPPDSPVQVRVQNDDQFTSVEVCNQGTPISTELLPVLFEPFRRGSDSRSPEPGHIGLGLFIVDQLVRAHGGVVTVSSMASAGTTFTVRLPR